MKQKAQDGECHFEEWIGDNYNTPTHSLAHCIPSYNQLLNNPSLNEAYDLSFSRYVTDLPSTDLRWLKQDVAPGYAAMAHIAVDE